MNVCVSNEPAIYECKWPLLCFLNFFLILGASLSESLSSHLTPSLATLCDHLGTVLGGQVLYFKNTYGSQVKGTFVRRSRQRRSFKLPTFLKILIYFENL